MRKVLAVVFGVGMLLIPAFYASAALLPLNEQWNGTMVIPTTGNDTGSAVSYNPQNGMDWDSNGVGAAFGFEFVLGDTFDFVYQSLVTDIKTGTGGAIPTLTDHIDPNNTGGAIVADKFQLTTVAQFGERVYAIGQDIFGNPTAAFVPNSTDPGFFEIWYDDLTIAGTAADVTAGTGMNDGTMVMSGHFSYSRIPSVFTAYSATQGTGAIGQLIATVDSYDNTFFVDGPGWWDDLIGLLVAGTLDTPRSDPVTGLFNGWDPDQAIVFQVDASTEQMRPIPEPGTMILLGSGLMGLAGIARRRKES